MDQEREDYRDGPDPPPSQWTSTRVLWLLLPIGLAIVTFAAVYLLGHSRQYAFDQ